MATNTYYSAFFPPVETAGEKGTTIAAVPSSAVTAVQQDINTIKTTIVKPLEDGGYLDTTAPDIISGVNLSTSIALDNTGAQTVTLVVTWNKSTAKDLASYDLEIKENAGSYVLFSTGIDTSPGFTQSYTFTVRAGQTFTVRVRAVDKAGNQGTWSPEASTLSAKDSVPPAKPVLIAVQPTYESVNVTFQAPSDLDLSAVVVYIYNGSNQLIGNRTIPTAPSGSANTIYSSLTKATTYSLALEAIDTSGNYSGKTAPISFTTAGGISADDFTPGLAPLKTVTALPDPNGYTGPSVVFFDNELYTYTNGAWKGLVSDSSITSLDSTTLVSGVSGANTLGDAFKSADWNAITYKPANVQSLVGNEILDNSKIIVGGVNLIKKTDYQNASYSISSFIPSGMANSKSGWGIKLNRTTDTPIIFLNARNIPQATDFILSFVAWVSGGDAPAHLTADLYPDDLPQAEFYVTTTPTRYTFLINSNSANMANANIRFFMEDPASNNKQVSITDIQLEQGNKATDWKASPYDTAVLINAGFVGDLNATNGAPVGTLVGNTLAQAIESYASDPASRINNVVGSTILGTKISDNSIEAGKIVTNSLTSDQIKAGSINTQSLLIGDFTNFAENSDFQQGPVGWTLQNNSGSAPVIKSVPGQGYKGSWFGYAAGNSTGGFRNNGRMRVNPGDQLYMFAYVDITSGNYVAVRISWLDANGTEVQVNYGGRNTVGTGAYNAYSKIDGSAIAPANAVFARVEVFYDVANGEIFLGAAGLMRRSTGELIVDGAISTNKLSANAVTADKILAGSINTTKLVAATRPFSIIGMNMRVDVDGILRWDGGIAQITQSDGTINTRNLYSGYYNYPGYPVRFFLNCTDGATNLNIDVEAYNGTVLINNPDFKIVATWNGSGGLEVSAGVGTYISGDKIVTGSIRAGKLAANSVLANNIASNSVATNKLVVASRPVSVAGLNLRVVNGVLNWDAANIVTVADDGSSAIYGIKAGTASGPLYLLYLPGSDHLDYNQDVSFRTNDAYITLAYYDGGTEITPIAGVSTIITGDRIVTNTIDASKIRAYSITTTQIAIGSLDAGTVIKNGSITTNNLGANTITGDKIVANTIAANKLTISSRPAATVGANMFVDTDGLLKWSAHTFTIIADDGTVATYNIRGASGLGYSGQPIYIFHYGDRPYYDYGVGDRTYFDGGGSVPVAIWNGGSDLTILTGVSTIINGAGILTGSINANKITANTLYGNQIIAGTIQAAQLAVGAVTTDKILIGSLTTLNADPGFRDTTFWDNTGIYNGSLGTNAGTVPGWYNIHGSDINTVMGTTQYCMLWDAYYKSNGRQHLISHAKYNIRGGSIYQLAAFGNNQSNQALNVYFRMYDVNGAFLADQVLVWNVGETQAKKQLQFTAPSNVNSYQFLVFNQADGPAFAGHMEVSALQVTEAAGSTAIQNGAITTDKITVGTLNGDRITTNTLDANTIKAGSIMSGSVFVGNASTTVMSLGTTATWSGVSGPNKPQDNATVGAPVGTYVGSLLAQDVISALSNISSDNVLSRSEKSQIITTYAAVGSAYLEANNTSAAFIPLYGDVTYNDRLNADRYYGALTDYLNSLSPAWNDTSSDTVIDGNTFRQRFQDSINATKTLAVSNTAVTASRAQWNGVSGANKPADNATVGAPTGTTVGGTEASQVAANAAVGASDPGTRINQGSTQINPGQILISGGTTLANWRYGGDTTKIEGGNIAANTITANKLTIGNRNLNVQDFSFQANPATNTVSWTGGYVTWIDDNGNPTGTSVSNGSAPFNGNYVYIYWTKGASSLSTGTNLQSVSGDNVPFAIYQGGSFLVVNYGGTIIDGSRITTGSITADRLQVNSLDALNARIGLLRTATSGPRLEISDNYIKIYNDAGNLAVQMGDLTK